MKTDWTTVFLQKLFASTGLVRILLYPNIILLAKGNSNVYSYKCGILLDREAYLVAVNKVHGLDSGTSQNQKLYFAETVDTAELNPQNSHSEIVLKLGKSAKNQITT